MYDLETKKYVVFDIEANGFDPDVIHCIVAKDLREGITHQFYEDTLGEAVEYLSMADGLVGHNIITYDLPVLNKLLGFDYKGEVVDTLVLSKVLNPDRQLPKNCPTSNHNPHTGRLDKVTPHSLESWGYRVGRGKPPYYEWDTFDMEMLHRCTEDVEINHLVFNALLEEAADNNWDTAFELEHVIAQMIYQQEVNGVTFDLPLAHKHIEELDGILSSIYEELKQYWHMELVVKTELKKPFKKNGDYTKAATDWYDQPEVIGGPFTRIEWHELQLTQRDKLANQLLKLGWKPTIKTDSGNGWKITDKAKPVKSLLEMKLPVGKELAKYYTYAHRRSQIVGWIEKLRPDGRLTAGADSAGTNTARMKHRIVVNCPKADPKVLFGKQMRQLFIPAHNHYMVGWDASGLEARVMGHYTHKFDGGEFADLILEGDIHSHNAHIFFPEETDGLTKADPEFTPYRNLSKNGFYALAYGAQVPKLAETLKIPVKVAQKRFNDFWEGNPALGKLRDKVMRIAEEWGYVPGIDERKIFIRSSHSALNALFQSAGSIIMKQSARLLMQALEAEGLEYKFLLNMHDEIQAEVHKRFILSYTSENLDDCLSRPYRGQEWTEPHLDEEGYYHTYYSRVGELATQSIRDAGAFFETRVPMDAEYMVGNNWADTH